MWQRVPCFVVHPGPPGDRGPASLDHAVLRGEAEWGVTVLQAVADGVNVNYDVYRIKTEVSEQGAQTLGKIAAVLAYGEGLQAHAMAAEFRLKKD